MCERQEIRFVHYMEHPRYSETLACGCDCAAKMEDNSVAAETRDKAMRNNARRRVGFLKRKTWRKSQKGNDYIDLDGFHIVVFRRGKGWAGRVSQVFLDIEFSSKKTYPSSDAAKLASFDAVMMLKAKHKL